MSVNADTGLALYLKQLYDDWYAELEKEFYPKCQRNLRAIKGKHTEVWKKNEGQKWRSTTEIKLIKVKVLTAFAILTDVFLQGDMIPFSLKHSPFEENKILEQGGEEAEGINRDIEDMSDKIREQLSARKVDREYMKKILSMAYYGAGFSKYTIKKIREMLYVPTVVEVDGESVEVPDMPVKKINEKPVPGHEYRSVWCIVSDPEDGNLQTNRGTFERDLVCPFELLQRKGRLGYIPDAIDEVLSQAALKRDPEKTETLKPYLRNISERRRAIDNHEFWGRVPRVLADEFEQEISKQGDTTVMVSSLYDYAEAEKSGDEVEVLVETADDVIIRYIRRELGARRPYNRALWEEQLDEEAGIGIADNMQDVQTAHVGMIRAYEDNKKLSANVMTATKSRLFAGGIAPVMEPGGNFEVSPDCDDARRALQQVIIQDVGENLLSGIGLMEKLGDVVSQVPSISQGFSLPKHKPDTLGEIELMMQNLGKYFGMIVRNIDEGFVEPEITDLYDYNMRDPDYTGAKTNMKVVATGFNSFHSKTLKMQKIKEVIGLALSDRSGLLHKEIKLRAHLEEIYKQMDLDVDVFLKSQTEKEEEMMKEAQAREAAEAKQMAVVQEEAERKAALESQKSEEDFQRDLLKRELGAG